MFLSARIYQKCEALLSELVREAIALDAKSIDLMTRSQLTILTEEVRQERHRTLV